LFWLSGCFFFGYLVVVVQLLKKELLLAIYFGYLVAVVYSLVVVALLHHLFHVRAHLHSFFQSYQTLPSQSSLQ